MPLNKKVPTDTLFGQTLISGHPCGMSDVDSILLNGEACESSWYLVDVDAGVGIRYATESAESENGTLMEMVRGVFEIIPTANWKDKDWNKTWQSK